MIIQVYHNNQKIKITLQDPSLEQLYKQVQEILKLPFDFDLRDENNKMVFNLQEQQIVFVTEIHRTIEQQETFKIQHSLYPYGKYQRNRVHSLGLIGHKSVSLTDTSLQNEQSLHYKKKEAIYSRIEKEKIQHQEMKKINKEGNKLIQQIQQRIQLREKLLKLKDEALNQPEVEKRKAILAQRRELSQPIRLEIINQHQQKYEEEKKLKLQERMQQKSEFLKELKQNLVKFPKSQALVRLEKQWEIEKQLSIKNFELKKQLKSKQQQYGDNIKESFFQDLSKKYQISPIKMQDYQINYKTQIEINKQNKIKLQQQQEEQNISQQYKINNIETQIKQKLSTDKKLYMKRQSLRKSLQYNFPTNIQEQQIDQIEQQYQIVLKQIKILEKQQKEKESKLFQQQKLDQEENEQFLQKIKAKLVSL